MNLHSVESQVKRSGISDRHKMQEWYEAVLPHYLNMKLTLPITDKSMRRVCQSLTNHGFTTYESCEGHGKDLPKIWFKCKSQIRLANIAYLVNRRMEEDRLPRLSHFQWDINLISKDPRLYNIQEPDYLLKPTGSLNEINLHQDRSRLLEDLDFIGFEVMSYFNIPWPDTKVNPSLAKKWHSLWR